jgi:hypothetical protein
MAPPAYQGIGGHEDYPWGQPTYGLPFPDDDMNTVTNPYITQPGIGHLDPDGNVSFDNNFYAGIIMMQAPVGTGRTPQASLNNIDNFMPNGNGPQGHTHDNIPRGSAANEQMQNLFASSFPMANNNPPGIPNPAEEGQDESEYVAVARTPHVSKRTRKPPTPNPSSEEWERRKLEIQSLYYFGNHTLEYTRAEMEKNGFHAQSVTAPSLRAGSIILTLHNFAERGCIKKGLDIGAGQHTKMAKTVETPGENHPLKNQRSGPEEKLQALQARKPSNQTILAIPLWL